MRDIVRAIESIAAFVAGQDYVAFASDQKTQFAVIRAMEIIGEASKLVPEYIKVKCPDVPWKKMAGMRDKLIHAYFGADLGLVWKTTTEILPALKPRIQSVLEEFTTEEE